MMFKSGYCEGHGKTFSPASLEVVHHGFWGVFRIIIITSALFFLLGMVLDVLWNVPCATGCNTTPKHDWSNSWTDVLFMKFSALCSPDIPLLILAKKFYFNLTSPKCIRLVSMFFCKIQMLNFAVRMQERISSDDSSMKTILVQVPLNSWTVDHISNVGQIFMEVSCSQTGILTCLSCNPAKSSFWYFSWSSRRCFVLHCSC